MTLAVERATFPAMSTTVEITGVGVPTHEVTRAAKRGRILAEEWEDRFSRFRPHSQLCRLNAAGGEAIRVDDEFLSLLDTVILAVARTAGRFDPSILPALEAAGYDRSIERVRTAPSPATCARPSAAGPAGWALVRIDHDRGEVQLPAGMRVDFGGVAKGRFVDRFASALSHWPGGCVDAGGDLRLWSVAPHGERWTIGIEDPSRPERDLLVAEIATHGVVGIATSGTHRRQWHAGGRLVHHLIDPRTVLPLATGARSVTAVARDVTAAEVATKALMVATTEVKTDDLFDADVAVVTYADGRVAILPEDNQHATALSRFWSIPRSA